MTATAFFVGATITILSITRRLLLLNNSSMLISVCWSHYWRGKISCCHDRSTDGAPAVMKISERMFKIIEFLPVRARPTINSWSNPFTYYTVIDKRTVSFTAWTIAYAWLWFLDIKILSWRPRPLSSVSMEAFCHKRANSCWEILFQDVWVRLTDRMDQ